MDYRIGQHPPCPTCDSPRAKVVWKGEDQKTIAVRCPRSRKHKRRVVILVDVEGKT